MLRNMKDILTGELNEKSQVVTNLRGGKQSKIYVLFSEIPPIGLEALLSVWEDAAREGTIDKGHDVLILEAQKDYANLMCNDKDSAMYYLLHILTSVFSILENECRDVILNDEDGVVNYDMDLLPVMAIREVAAVMTAGAEKYGSGNWHSISCKSNLDHCMLHLNNWAIKDNYEELTHAAARIMMAVEQFHREGWKEDDFAGK